MPRPSRSPISWLTSTLLIALAAALGLGLLATGTATAAPSSSSTASTAEEATRLAGEAERQLETVAEQVNDARAELAAQQKTVVEARDAAEQAEQQRAELDAQMRAVARSAYAGENVSRLNALMTSSSAEDFLDQVTTLDALAGHTSDVLTEVAAASEAAAQAQQDAEDAAAKAKDALAAVSSQQDDLQEKISSYKAQYETLTAAQQEEVTTASTGREVAAPATVKADSAAAQTAVDTALAQRGDPYVWGAAGPNAFDCSGLMQYAYAAAGISLPHSSLAQSTMGTPVSRSDLQPGDLVFFYSPVSHVGMYIGGGKMVHASTFGKPVLVASVDMGGYVGARRLAG